MGCDIHIVVERKLPGSEWLTANPEHSEVRADFALYDLLGIDADWPANAEYRVVFWFDN